MELNEIDKIVKETLSEKRYYHSVCTMEMCEKLSNMYGYDILGAKKVGLAHDIAKEMSEDEKIKYCTENNIAIDNIELLSPTLLHAKIGADICKKRFGFSDELCNAVKKHTTGGLHMTLIDKILYVADGIGDDRTWDDKEFVKKLAFEDLDKAVLYMLNMSIEECIKENKLLHLDTIICRNEMMKKDVE
jgi:predicted HD superfamily hydrolase involved in NAD metabolism